MNVEAIAAASCRLIPLRGGGFAVVDAADWPALSPFVWRLHPRGYAAREYRVSGRRGPVTVLMHRELMRPLPHEEVDHVNRDPLDNRRENLRVCSKSQNQGNSRKRVSYCGEPPTSRYKGVSWHRAGGKWSATITIDRRQHWLGLYESEIEAAWAYDRAAAAVFGPFALVNFPGTVNAPLTAAPGLIP